ncbi:DNA-directed RNA polymerase subunit K [Candidatus Pacearchaeota archaeon]|nr:DNA-directed RNA polymerase subunit K [Candidatus Pacearchaeota archaeon]|tara:strand:- start:2528 stop:2929 length:402 start_codon:yes stop_codon:yes gene_type:complete
MAEPKREFTKYERARIIGARGLQVSMDAPLLLKISKEDLNGVNFDPLRIAEKELDSGVLPITVNRPMPRRKEEDIAKVKLEDKTLSDEEKAKAEAEEEKEIQESGEIMEMATSSEEEVEERASAKPVISEELS